MNVTWLIKKFQNYEIASADGTAIAAASALKDLALKTEAKSAKDLSLLWTLVLLTGLIFYAIYAYASNVLPLLVFATVESVLTIILILLKIKYDRAKR